MHRCWQGLYWQGPWHWLEQAKINRWCLRKGDRVQHGIKRDQRYPAINPGRNVAAEEWANGIRTIGGKS